MYCTGPLLATEASPPACGAPVCGSGERGLHRGQVTCLPGPVALALPPSLRHAHLRRRTSSASLPCAAPCLGARCAACSWPSSSITPSDQILASRATVRCRFVFVEVLLLPQLLHIPKRCHDYKANRISTSSSFSTSI
ncbi:hypothetical protein BDZ91DRAFT_14486 [Kalaharituber pfeilii]|nr:hypothetical protein BDZ91DRAFT_14486 [Kalaharituber pfeilii]